MKLYLLAKLLGGVVLLGVSTYTTGALSRRIEVGRTPGAVLRLSALMVLMILIGLLGLALASSDLID